MELESTLAIANSNIGFFKDMLGKINQTENGVIAADHVSGTASHDGYTQISDEESVTDTPAISTDMELVGQPMIVNVLRRSYYSSFNVVIDQPNKVISSNDAGLSISLPAQARLSKFFVQGRVISCQGDKAMDEVEELRQLIVYGKTPR